jgi:hypothetical protein
LNFLPQTAPSWEAVLLRKIILIEDSAKCRHLKNWPVPEIIDLVFAKTSPKRSFSMTEYERIGLVFTKTGSINSGTVFALRRCLSVWGSEPHTPPPPLYNVYVSTVYLFTQGRGKGGELKQRKGERGNSSQSQSKIPTRLTLTPVYKLW